MKQLNNRRELARLAAGMGCRECAEVGVFLGQYSEVLCQEIPGLHLYCIDIWAPSGAHPSARRMERYFHEAQARLRNYDCTFMRMTSLEAARKIPDGFLDMVYIDADHSDKAVSLDIPAWVPKVKAGGIVAGHDWGHRGVTPAVERYVSQHPEIELQTTKLAPEDWMASWWWVKNA